MKSLITTQRLFLASIALFAIAVFGTRVSAASGDQAFVDSAWHANSEEVSEGRYILKHTNDPKTRQFAQMMIDDHSTANVKLLTAVRKTTLAAPEMPARGMQNAAMMPPPLALAGLSGPALSKAYFTMAVSDHKKALDLMTTEASSGTAPSLKMYASESEPVVRKHYDLASQWVSSGGKLPVSFTSGPAPGMMATSAPMIGEPNGPRQSAEPTVATSATANPQPTSSSVVATPLPTNTPGPP